MEQYTTEIARPSSGSPTDHPSLTGDQSPGSSSQDTPIPSASSANSSESRIPPPTVPAACLACRSKHLKCDGQNPCSRCRSSNSECIYVASRRGYKGPRRGIAHNPNKRHASSSPPAPATGDCPMLLGAGAAVATTAPMPASVAAFNPAIVLPQTPHASFSGTPGLNHLQLYRQPFGSANGIDTTNLMLSQHATTVLAQVPVPTPAERCLDSFYHHYHASHPFVLPKEFLLRIANDTSIDHLLAAIRWIGSLFIDIGGPTRAMFFDDALRMAYEEPTPKDGFLVQTLLLLIVGLDGSCQQEKARKILADAERIAIQIGLHTRPFATIHGRGIPVLEESWRRTWWDLYVVDGMIAGVHRQTNFLLFDLQSDVALPCEEQLYTSGSIPLPMYLEDLEDREFSGEEREFSSFAYRIAAARTLGKFMRCPPIFGPEDENIARIESMLTNWRLHLPLTKKDALHKNGILDEMMFQAHMMTHATSILLHQPHSQLDSSPARAVTSCAPHRHVPSGSEFNAHTRHTIASANEISKMVTHRVPLLSHTHFFTCVVTLSSIVHLSKWNLFFIPHDDDDLRQQIRLNIGALNKLSEVWKAADTASGQVKGVAQEIYRNKKSQQSNPVYWVGFTTQEVMNSIAADESIMGEIENLGATSHIIPG